MSTKTYAIDNRWAVGALEEKIPDNALAVYGARWIDHDTWMDIVPDRQGFAYDSAVGRDRLIDRMEGSDLRGYATALERDVAVEFKHVVKDGFRCWMRRSGGYVYVAAWIEEE
jgi:hypothetical protein